MHAAYDLASEWDQRISTQVTHRGVLCTWGQDLKGKVRAPHRHFGIEIVYCERGEGKYYVGGQDHALLPGVILIFPANLPHFMRVNNRFERWKLCFHPKSLADNDSLINTFVPQSTAFNSTMIPPGYYQVQSEERKRFRRVFQEITAEVRANESNGQQFIQLLLAQLAILVNRNASVDFESVERNGHTVTTKSVQQMLQYIDDHFADDLTVDRLADVFHYTPGHIWRLFKDEIGLSPVEYINERRLSEAKTYLLTTDKSISAIAHEIGFRHASYFSQVFRKQSGLTPREYRAAQFPGARD